ncbi:MAG: 3-hydroxyacyl-CoA dehydrogenase NAD-binding [Gemmatimonadetes bacterium]|nr:3-hydroxyacyl-CoA dehydrogenase NAD-binding [Gemmatimonadota bacterium]
MQRNPSAEPADVRRLPFSPEDHPLTVEEAPLDDISGSPLRAGDPHLRVDGGGIASIVFSAAGGGPNVLGTAALDRLDAILAEVEHGVTVDAVRAVVVRSALPATWISGADLREVRAIPDAAAGEALARRGQAVLRRLETLAVPTFAALRGACLGAGAELALACSYRLAADSANTLLGFPEVRYGLIAALGGTVRLPRLVGARSALGLILTGRSVDASEAKALGLVDAVFAAAEMDARVADFVRERLERGRRRTGARRGVARRLVEDTAPGRRALFARVRRGLRAPEAAHNPAGLRALEVVAEGIGLPLDAAFALEARAFGELAVTDEARGLMHAFSLRRVARGPVTDSAETPARLDTVALLGGGVSAGALAHRLAARGMEVRVRDPDRAAVAEAVRFAADALRWERSNGSLSRADSIASRERVTGAQGFGGFGTVDLAVEVLVGSEERKRTVLREAEDHLREGAVLAATALAIPVDAIACDLARPESLAGLRLFPSPEDARIAEVVRGARTSPRTVASLVELAQRLELPAVAVADAPGGLLHRLAAVYVQEAVALLGEGASVAQVDGAARGFGMAEGPLALADRIGTASLARVAAAVHGSGGDPVRSADALEMLVRREVLGVRAGRGFYTYAARHEPRPAPEIAALVREGDGVPRPAPDGPAILGRLLLSLVNEAAAVLEEGIAGGPDEVDLAMMIGFGFPAFRGGLLFHADRIGLPAVVASLRALRERHGPRFEPGARLRRLADEGRGFHDG